MSGPIDSLRLCGVACCVFKFQFPKRDRFLLPLYPRVYLCPSRSGDCYFRGRNTKIADTNPINSLRLCVFALSAFIFGF